jgi:hypothetical protein
VLGRLFGNTLSHTATPSAALPIWIDSFQLKFKHYNLKIQHT